jgi:Na+-translocating ferredoxin:NAD+ oxidoreductase RnfG subunit
MDSRFWTLFPLLLAPPAACYAVQYLTVEQAQALIFPEGTRFAPADVTMTPEQAAAVERASGQRVRAPLQRAWQAYAGERRLGTLLLDEVFGKHEFITYALGINADGSVRQIEIMDYRETHGGQVRDAAWRAQFAGKRAGAPLRLDEDIRNISGATLSCKHVTEGVRRLLVVHEQLFR